MRASCLSLLDSIVDLRRAPGRAGPALLCVWLATACSATRAYEGPALSKDQVATISEYPRGVGAMFGSVGRQLALGTDWSSELAGVDDGEDVSLWNDGGAEVLPGRHAVRVTVVEQSVAGTSFHRDLLAVFDAAAGHEYELRARGPTLGGAPGFDVWDVQADAAIASSDARPEECVTARTAWDGRHWTQADWGRNAGLCSTSYVPSG
ncbi:MAG TPA: hypothetical protein VK824_12435, partial [Planctomycetota bacterium]|nr:hypothetical protein [Planctomycetota bacterium]